MLLQGESLLFPLTVLSRFSMHHWQQTMFHQSKAISQGMGTSSSARTQWPNNKLFICMFSYPTYMIGLTTGRQRLSGRQVNNISSVVNM